MGHAIVLVRHAVGYHNLASDDGCDLEVYDAKLTPAGRREARRHAKGVFGLLPSSSKRPVVLVSPLRRCLQTCLCMLDAVDPSGRLETPVVEPLLVESSAGDDSAGHPVGFLRRYYPDFDWRPLDVAPSEWRARRFRMDRERPARARAALLRRARLDPVVAFTHGNLIAEITGHSLHNCEAVVSTNMGRSWRRYRIGKSPSRLDTRRSRMC